MVPAFRTPETTARSDASGRLEDLVEVPLQELAVRPVDPPGRKRDDLPGLRVELLAVAELTPQPRAQGLLRVGFTRLVRYGP